MATSVKFKMTAAQLNICRFNVSLIFFHPKKSQPCNNYFNKVYYQQWE